MIRPVTAALHGALAGAVATLPMSAVMLAAGRAGLMGKQPPELIAETAFGAAGVRPAEWVSNVAGTAAHIGFGAAAGALFGLMHRRRELPVPPAVLGMGFGLLVYTVSYEGWVPALTALPSPEHDRPGRQPSMIAAHLVYGAVLGALAERG